MLKIVLDTNILVSAILFGGKTKLILEKAIHGEIRLCISGPILDELSGVLQRRKFGYSPELVQVMLKELTDLSDFVDPSTAIDVVLEDREDNRILECAVEAEANYIITGNFHLLKLKRYRNIEILNPGAFLERFSSISKSP